MAGQQGLPFHDQYFSMAYLWYLESCCCMLVSPVSMQELSAQKMFN